MSFSFLRTKTSFFFVFFYPPFVIFFFGETALSIDPFFKDCEPYSCGEGPNISYPFYVYGSQPSYCGFPGFNLVCDDRKPLLQISQNELYLTEIFPENQSVALVSKNFPRDNCPRDIKNLTLSRTPFSYEPTKLNLIFFFNCNGSFPGGIRNYQINCMTNGTHRSYATLYGKQVVGLKCETAAEAPAGVLAEGDVEGYLLRNDYLGMFKKGFLFKWTASNCSDCERSGGRCGFNSSQFLCFCHDRPYKFRCSGNEGKEVAIKRKLLIGISAGAATGISAGVVSLLAACFIFFIIHRRKCSKFSLERFSLRSLLCFSKKKTSVPQNVEAFLQKNYGSLALRRFNYLDLKKMTNSFIHKIGQGGYGSVFKGTLPDGRLVAVKLLIESKYNGEEFMNEVASIGRTYHINIVPLLGYCSDGSRRALIYEYMPNGSLDKFIFVEKARPLKWEKLCGIAVGIARGLEYLHRGCSIRILHFDIKPHNILLDKDYCPKISNFGLAKLCLTNDSMVSMLGARGTVGYIAPEVFSRNFGRVSYKSDVYSYGMMVLEMVGGRKNIDAHVENTSEIYFPQWIYKRIDQKRDLELQGIMTEEDEIMARKMILVSLWCIQPSPGSRPSMSRVVEMLEGRLEGLEMPPEPFLSSPPRSEPEEISTFPIL